MMASEAKYACLRRSRLAATAMCCLVPVAVHASSCRRQIIVPIHFKQGALCWQHDGTGTTFTGHFLAGQHVTATAGESENGGNPANTERWQLIVSGPNDFTAKTDDAGQLDAVLPASGEYRFVTLPCAIWGGKGMVKICAQ